jgi:hypothetical protein
MAEVHERIAGAHQAVVHLSSSKKIGGSEKSLEKGTAESDS